MFEVRKPLIVANWKMYKNIGEAKNFIQEFLPKVHGLTEVDIALCPPFTCLDSVRQSLNGSGVNLGAQDVFWESQGAFTGEISPAMLLDLNCQYVIIGHSERRHVIKESNSIINRKLQAAHQAGLIPIFCVGETLEEREEGRTRNVLKEQLELGLQNIPAGKLVIAYEPVWAIGTGINASPADAQEMIGFIRDYLAIIYDRTWAEGVIILYGGSVKPDNAASFIVQRDVDGALVGGASLNANDFASIVRLSANV